MSLRESPEVSCENTAEANTNINKISKFSSNLRRSDRNRGRHFSRDDKKCKMSDCSGFKTIRGHEVMRSYEFLMSFVSGRGGEATGLGFQLQANVYLQLNSFALS